LQFVQILEVQKRPIVHYCAVRTSTSVRQFGYILMNTSAAHSARHNTNTHNLTQANTLYQWLNY